MKTQRKMLRLLMFSILAAIFILNSISILPGCSSGSDNKDNGGSSGDNGTISGTVTDNNGDPVQSARVDFEYTDDEPEPSPSPSPSKGTDSKQIIASKADASTTTDESGSFTLSGLTTGREGVVIISKDNQVFGSKSVNVQSSTTVDVANTGLVRGIISEGGTDVIADVNVSIGTLSTLTNSLGSYTIGGIAFGNQTIRATKSGYQVYTDTVVVIDGSITYKDIDLAQGSSPTPSPSQSASPSPSPSPTTSPTSSPSPSPSPTSSASPSPSPLPTSGYTFSAKWDTGLNGPGNLGSGSIIGSNFASATLFEYEPDGTFVGNIAVPEACNGVTVDQNGHLFASSNLTKNFYKLAAPDWSVTTVHATANQPIDIAAEYQTNRVYVLTGSVAQYRVEIFDVTGASVSSWELKNDFTNPKSMAVSPTGKIYISFLGSNRIVYFDLTGNKLGEIALNLPYGVYVDANSKLYVNYTYSNTTLQRAIAVYDINHSLIDGHISANGTGNDQMMNPYGIVTDSSGNIYVSDIGDDKIVKFTKK